MEQIERLVRGIIPPRVMRFVKQTGRGINRFKMIRENDRVVIGISGGKDSLALALALALRKRWLPIDYKLHAFHINWKEYPLPDAYHKKLKDFFDILEIPCTIKEASMFPESFKGSFNCYLCSRNRKRMLFDFADEIGFDKIALGHHQDDLVETALMNLCLRGRFTTMLPVQEFFQGKLHVIRPLCEVPESMVKNISAFLELPIENIACPYRDTNIRVNIKPLVKEFSLLDRHIRDHVYDAFWKDKDDFRDLVFPL